MAKGIAVVLLALSVAPTGLAIYQTSKAHAIHGPGAPLLQLRIRNSGHYRTCSGLRCLCRRPA
jgi:hypothetical protein